jgi:Tfp pilus assembly protein PilF
MATIEQQRISWGELRERAQTLRTKSVKAGEPGLSMRVSDLLETLPLPYDPEPLPDDATAEEVQEAEREPLDFAEDVLKRHGVRTRPAPGDVGADGVVVLRPSNRYAVQGAAGLGILALLGAGAMSKIAFIGFAPFVAVGIWIAWRQMHLLDRWVPRIVPRGRILGALLMLVLLAISAIAVVQPARDWARNRGDVRNAVALSVQAEAQLAAGDLAGARASVDGALQAAPDLGQAIATSQKVMVAQIDANTAARLQAEAIAERAYDRGLNAVSARRWEQAITELAAAGAYADAPSQLAATRRAAANASLRTARSALAAGDATLAFERYSEAIAFDPTAVDRALLRRIGTALRSGS